MHRSPTRSGAGSAPAIRLVAGKPQASPKARGRQQKGQADSRRAHRHLSPATLARLRTGRLTAETATNEVVPHLLACCRGCAASAAELSRLVASVGYPDEVIAVEEGPAAPDLLTQIEGQSYESQVAIVEKSPRLRTWGFCRVLQRRAEEITSTDPNRAAELAKLALCVADGLGQSYDPHRIQDLGARALVLLASARRVAGEKGAAGDALERAKARWAAGGHDPAVNAGILLQEALLLRDEHRMVAALHPLDLAYRMTDDPVTCSLAIAEVAAAPVHWAWCRYHEGRVRSALHRLLAVEQHLGAARQDRVALALHSGKAWCCLTLDRAELLASVPATLAAIGKLCRRIGSEADRLRLRYAQARFDRAQGNHRAAAEALRAIGPAFEKIGLGVDAALVYLDLARLVVDQESTRAAAAGSEVRPSEPAATALRDLASKTQSLLGGTDLSPGGIEIILRFQEACRTDPDCLTSVSVRKLAQRLESSRRPDLTWWSAWGTNLEKPPKARKGDGQA